MATNDRSIFFHFRPTTHTTLAASLDEDDVVQSESGRMVDHVLLEFYTDQHGARASTIRQLLLLLSAEHHNSTPCVYCSILATLDRSPTRRIPMRPF